MSTGTSKFKRLGVVKEALFNCEAVGKRIWPDGLSFNMGGCKATKKPFSVIIKLKTVRLVDIDKKAMLSRLGYKDHLQSTRLIQPGSGKCAASEEELQRVVQELQDVLVQPPAREELLERAKRLSELKARLLKVNHRLSTDAAGDAKLKKKKQTLEKRIKHVDAWPSCGSGIGSISRSPAATPSTATQQQAQQPPAQAVAAGRAAPQQQQQQLQQENGGGLMTEDHGDDPGSTGGNDPAAPNGGVGADPPALLGTGSADGPVLKAEPQMPPMKGPSTASPVTPAQPGQRSRMTHSSGANGSPTPARQLGSAMDRAAAAAAAAHDGSPAVPQQRQQQPLARAPAASPAAAAGAAAAAAGAHAEDKQPAVQEKLQPVMLGGAKRPRIAGLLGPVKHSDGNPISSSSGLWGAAAVPAKT